MVTSIPRRLLGVAVGTVMAAATALLPMAAKAADAPNPLAKYLTPVVVDEFNPDVTDATRGKVAPKVGGSVKLRIRSDYEGLNPITGTGQPERMVVDAFMDSLVDQDVETLEYFPKMAWSFDKGDLIKQKGKDVEVGRFTKMDDQEVTFVPGAWLRTFNRFDVASYDAAKGVLTLKPEFGGTTFHGKISELPSTLVVDEATDPDKAAKAATFKVAELDTWQDKVTGKTVVRPFVKQQCAFMFHLRDGIKWDDGEPFTADDIKFSVDCILNPNIEAQHLQNYYQDAEKYEPRDGGKSFYFQWGRPYFAAFDFAAFIRGSRFIVPKHVFKPETFGGDEKAFAEAFNKHTYRERPTGLGCYKLKEWKKGSSLTIVRNPDYWANRLPDGAIHGWHPDMPYLDEVTWVVINENSASLLELKKGSVDGDMEMEQDQFVSPESDTPAFREVLVKAKSYGFMYVYIGWNMQREIFKDKDVRRALAMLIPREKILKDVHVGLGELVTGPWYSMGPGYDKSVPQIPYDPAEAKKLLRKAGWLDRDKDGTLDKTIDGKKVDFKFEYLIHNAKEYHQKVADIIKESVEQVGIKMSIKKLDWAIYKDQVKEKQFDAVRYAWGTTLEPDGLQQWHSSQMENKGDNFVSYKNPRIDELMVKIRETFDSEARWKMAEEAHRIIADEQPYCFLFGFYNLYFYNRGLQNVKFYPSQYPWNVWEWYWAKPKPAGQ